jgi:hypothetical protein
MLLLKLEGIEYVRVFFSFLLLRFPSQQFPFNLLVQVALVAYIRSLYTEAMYNTSLCKLWRCQDNRSIVKRQKKITMDDAVS